MEQFVYGNPLFTEMSERWPVYPYLDRSVQCDILILGGGVTGALVAHFLKDIGMRVILVEQYRIAHMSTSITTSLLQYELDRTARQLEEEGIPLSDTIRTYKLGLDALQWLGAYAKSSQRDFSYSARDTLFFTREEKDVRIIEEEWDVRVLAELPIIDAVKGGDYPFPIARGITALSGGAELNPVAFTHALLEDAGKAGVEVYEHTYVDALTYDRSGVHATLRYGKMIHAKHVIHCTGYNAYPLLGRTYGTRYATFNVVTEPIDTQPIWPGGVLLRDSSNPYYYARITADNRVVLGGLDVPLKKNGIDRRTCDTQYRALSARLYEWFPATRGYDIAHRYAGTFVSTTDDRGYIGETSELGREHVCFGYGANGILYAILGGMYFREHFTNQRTDRYAQIKHLFHPER
ncbi:MAG: NAD(P)/FAD-dependent oxidoreductase [Bacilli bacterium]